MFANFTEETAAWVTGKLMLSGAIAKKIPYSASFADGDLVSYVAEDAMRKIAGIGTYNASDNSISLNDTWNFDGTVVDKNPSANIPLSGTVKVRCSQSTRNISAAPITLEGLRNIKPARAQGEAAGYNMTLTQYSAHFSPYLVPAGTTLNNMTAYIVTPVAGSFIKMGLATVDKATGLVGESLVESISIDASVAGRTDATTSPIFFPDETYVLGWIMCDQPSLVIEGVGRQHVHHDPRLWPSVSVGDRREQVLGLTVSNTSFVFPTGGVAGVSWLGPELLIGATHA